MTREQIEQQLRAENPTSVIDGVEMGAGDPAYEALMEQWVDAYEQTLADLAAARQDAPSWKVKIWMVRQGIDLTTIPGIIEGLYTAGPQRAEALLRWESAPVVPFAHPMVAALSAQLQIDPGQVWDEILAI